MPAGSGENVDYVKAFAKINEQQTNAMRNSKLVWIMVAAVGLLSGCNSVVMSSRISEHRDTWRGLSEQDQQRLMRGNVSRGDSEEMVQIALGQPDKVIPLTSTDGQRLTVWLFEDLIDSRKSSATDPISTNHLTNRERSVIFRDGVVVNQKLIATGDNSGFVEVRSTAQNLLARLNALVVLTPEQKEKAFEIYAKAQEKLLAFDTGERGPRGMPIQEKMRADIRAILTTGQQAKYDAMPPLFGGGLTWRR
jgi:hypothetical protein